MPQESEKERTTPAPNMSERKQETIWSVIRYFAASKWFRRSTAAWFTTNALRFTVVVFLFCLCVIIPLSWKHYDSDFWEQVLVAAHGATLDILLVGLVLVYFTQVGKRYSDAGRYRDIIDDFRFWQSEEAGIRIAGAVRRLNRLGYHELDLSHCTFRGASIESVDLHGSRFWHTDFSGARLTHVDLRGGEFLGVKFDRAVCMWVDFRNAAGLTVSELGKAALLSHCHFPDDVRAALEREYPATLDDVRCLFDDPAAAARVSEGLHFRDTKHYS